MSAYFMGGCASQEDYYYEAMGMYDGPDMDDYYYDDDDDY